VALAVTINDGGIWVLGLGSGGTVDLGGGSWTVPMIPQGFSSPVLVRYASTGTFLSAADLVASSACQTSGCNSSLAFDDAANVYALTGVFSQTNELLTKFAADGSPSWSASIAQGTPASGLAVSGSGVIALFGPFSLTLFGPNGSQRWSRPFQWASYLGPVAFDAAGNVLVGGTFAGAIDLGGPAPLQSPANDRQAPGDQQAQPMLLVKYDAAGKYLWSHAYGSTPRAQSKVGAIRVAANQDVLFTGGFAGAIDFGTGAYRTTADPADVGDHDVFLARLSPGGAGRWSDGFAGPGLGDTGTCVAIAPDGRLALGGEFDGSINLGNGPFMGVGIYGSQFGPGGDGFLAVFAGGQ
jgi:hypothetical protein